MGPPNAPIPSWEQSVPEVGASRELSPNTSAAKGLNSPDELATALESTRCIPPSPLPPPPARDDIAADSTTTVPDDVGQKGRAGADENGSATSNSPTAKHQDAVVAGTIEKIAIFTGSAAGGGGADTSPTAPASIPAVLWAPAPSVFDSSGRKTDRPAGGGSHVERAPERPAGNVAQAACAGAAGGGGRAVRTEVIALKEAASAYEFGVRSG